MKIDIEKIAKEQGEKIANAVMKKYDDNPHLLIDHVQKKKSFLSGFIKGYKEGSEEINIEKDIYERAQHEATAFFLKNSDLKFDSETIKALKFHLSIRVKQPVKLKNSTPEELLANVIKIFALDFLLEKNILMSKK